MEILSKINLFIESELLENRVSLQPDTPLFSAKLLDSLALIELLSFLEEEFGVKIKSSEILMENIDTPAFTARFIQSKLGRTGERTLLSHP